VGLLTPIPNKTSLKSGYHPLILTLPNLDFTDTSTAIVRAVMHSCSWFVQGQIPEFHLVGRGRKPDLDSHDCSFHSVCRLELGLLQKGRASKIIRTTAVAASQYTLLGPKTSHRPLPLSYSRAKNEGERQVHNLSTLDPHLAHPRMARYCCKM
jgi:hypothetical protein